MTAFPYRPHGAFPAHTVPSSLCLGSWAVRAAYTRCSLQPAPDSILLGPQYNVISRFGASIEKQ